MIYSTLAVIGFSLSSTRLVEGSTSVTKKSSLALIDALHKTGFQRMLGSVYLNDCLNLQGAEQCCAGPGTGEGAPCYGASFNVDVGSCVNPIDYDYFQGLKPACEDAGFESAEATVGKYSCIGAESCYGIAQKQGKAIVGDNSCTTETSCWEAGYNTGDFVVADNSCRGDGSGGQSQQICRDAGQEWGFSRIGQSACLGNFACIFTGKNSGSSLCGDSSCVGDHACDDTGSFSGDFATAANSCIGAYACSKAGQGGKAVVGMNSCKGPQACQFVGTEKGNSQIGDNSCVGDRACRSSSKWNVFTIKIGAGSCNCDDCCSCLVDGDEVPDGKCNTQGDGADQCCSGATSKSTGFSQMSGSVSDPTEPKIASPGDSSNNIISLTPPDYGVTFGECTSSFGTGATSGTIDCFFTIEGGPDYTVVSDVYGADCKGPVPAGVTKGTDTLDEARYDSQVSIASSGSTSSVKFCLKTTVKSKEGFAMHYLGQLLTLAFDYNGEFTVDSLTTVKFADGIADEKDLGSVSFGINGYRCDTSGNKETSNSLSLGDNLYICLETEASGSVVSDVTTFIATQGSITRNIISDSTANSNTFVVNKDTNKVTVVTKLDLAFFEEGGLVEISGSATIGNEGDSSRLLEASENPVAEGEVDSLFEMTVALNKVSYQKMSRPSAASTKYGIVSVGIALIGAVAIDVVS